MGRQPALAALAGALATALTIAASSLDGSSPSGGSGDPDGGRVSASVKSGAEVPMVACRNRPVRWRRSRAIGAPAGGRLVRGVQFPCEGQHFFTWDPIRRVSPNRRWRRYGTDRLVRMVLRVMRDYSRRHPTAPRVGIGDLSRPRGGEFGPRFGGPGHASHRNGLDVDVYYPRRDRRERPPRRPAQVDLRLAQDLVDLFVRAGAQTVFVGPNVRLDGPADVVVPLRRHDDHLHVRIR